MFALLMSKRLPLFVLLGVAIHLFFFAIYTKLVLGSRAMVDATRVAGRSTLLAEYVATNIEVFQSIFDLNPLHGLEPSAWPAIRTSMTGDAQELSSVNQMVYVGAKVKGIKSGLRDTLFEVRRAGGRGGGASLCGVCMTGRGVHGCEGCAWLGGCA